MPNKMLFALSKKHVLPVDELEKMGPSKGNMGEEKISFKQFLLINGDM